jgi:RimJ/RimL family protein N-acetyltransferase
VGDKMNIKGKNILLRAIEPKDNSMLMKIINDDETEYLLGGWSFPVSQKNQEDWTNNLKINNNILRCTIDVQGIAIGVVMLTDIDYKNGNAEVHIKLSVDSNARGKGYGTEALLTIIRYAFDELRLKCIYARVSNHNEASKRLFTKCGFKEEGVLRSRLFKRGEYIDVISFSYINENE